MLRFTVTRSAFSRAKLGGTTGSELSRIITYLRTLSAAEIAEKPFFRSRSCKEIVVLMEEIRRGVPWTGGRDRSFFWYAILGWKLIWEADPSSPTTGSFTSPRPAITA